MIFCEDYQPLKTPEVPSQHIDGLANAQEVIYAAFAKALEPTPPIDFLEWAQKNVFFGAESQFQGAFNSDLFPFFKKPLRCLEPSHPAREVILMGSAQVGKTVCAQVFVGASIDLDPCPFMYTHPSLENAARWVRTKWKPFVTQSPSLRKIFPGEVRSRDASNTLLVKERADSRGVMVVSGANSAASLAMLSVPRQVQDDLSKWEDNEHGDSEGQADKRSQGFGDWAKIFKVSTPSILGVCKIDKNYKRSNQQKYHVPCPGCGHKHALEWENFKKSLYEGMEFSEAHFHCPACGHVIEHHHKEWMLDQTLAYDAWVAENSSSKVEGFYIWCAYSRLTSWAYIAEEYFKALGDPEKEKTFMTDTVGLPYEQKGEAPPWKELYERAAGSDYEVGTVPINALILTAGLDVQGDRVEWNVKGWGPNLQRFTIQHGVIEGHISSELVQKQLDGLLNRKWRNRFGRQIGLDMLAIDANFETNDVKTWAKKHPESRVITIKGAKEYTAPPMVPVQEERRNNGKRVNRHQKRHWLVGVSGLKGSLYKNLDKKDPLEKGYCGFPKDLEENYFQQLTSETRVLDVDKKTKATRYIWVKLPTFRNEILDMELYAEVAARRLGWHTKSEQDWEALRNTRECPPDDVQLDLLDPATMLSNTAVTVKTDTKPSLASQLA